MDKNNLSYVSIHLATGEYGNELMQQLALEALEKRKDYSPLIVEVYEHAGWWLSYTMWEGKLIIVGTANDAAVSSNECKMFWAKYKGYTPRNIEDIRR